MASAQTTWTGAIDSDWSKPGNWSAGLPSNSLSPVIALDGAVVNVTAPVSAKNTLISGNGALKPILNITSDYTNPESTFTVGSHASETGYSATVNHTAGTVSISGANGNRRLAIAALSTANTSNNSGTYNFGGSSDDSPTLIVGGAILMGRRVGESAVMTLSGYGSLSQGTQGAEHFQLGQFNGSATLNVIGGNLDIHLANNLILLPNNNGSAVLNATLTSSGFSTIHVGGTVQFSNGTGSNKTVFNLSLDGYAGAIGDIITIIDAGTAFTGFSAFGNVKQDQIISLSGYDFKAIYDLTNHDFKLEVVAIPEASTTAMMVLNLGLLGLATLYFRR